MEITSLNMSITFIDIILLVLLFINVIRCLFRGFLAEIMSIMRFFLSIGIASIFTAPVSAILAQYIEKMFIAIIVSFGIIVIIVYILLHILELFMQYCITILKAHELDKFLGIIIGMIEMLIISILLLYILDIQPFKQLQEWYKDSITYRLLHPYFFNIEHIIDKFKLITP